MVRSPVYFGILLILLGSTGCSYKAGLEVNNLGVEEYIELLKSNSYDSANLPSFTSRDIPALLEYRNEKEIITNFPRNGISSLYGPECTLGIYVLWTIESIRAVSINSPKLILRFPSLNPVLALRNSDVHELVYDDKSHETAAKAYFNWWESNKHRNFSEFDQIDPLEGTDYKWH